MSNPASTSLTHFTQAYISGLLLSQRKTPHAMWEEGFLPFTPSRTSPLMAQDPHPYEANLPKRLQKSPRDPYLAVDLMPSPHTGPQIQGLGQVYHPGRKAPVWGHLFLSLTLVYPHRDPYPLALKPFLNPGMETPLYPAKTPSEALLDEIFDLLALEPGLNLKAVVADAQFSGGLTLRSLIRAGVPFVGRMRSRVKVRPLDPEAGEVLLAYPSGRARYYRRFGAYAKRVRVEWPQVGWVDLVLVWVGRGAGWWGLALVSTLAGGVQEVLEAWFCRWKAEVVHRLYSRTWGRGGARRVRLRRSSCMRSWWYGPFTR